MAPKHIVFWTTFLGVLAVDQITKLWVVANLAYRDDEIVVIPHFLSIIHAQNPGAAFGLMNDFAYRYWVFGAFTVIVCVICLDLYRRVDAGDRVIAASLGAILGGSVGNAIDRAHKRSVTDFVKVYTDAPELSAWLIERVGTAEWPTFNVADSALLVGLALFLGHAMSSDGDGDDALGEPPAGGDSETRDREGRELPSR